MYETYTAADYRRDVATVTSDATLAEAASLMAEHGVGLLVVTDGDGVLTGVVTDRDLCLRAVGREGVPADAPVRRVQTETVVSAPPDESVDEVVRAMRVRGVRRVVLVEDGRPVGVVSMDDVLGELSRDLHALGEGIRLQNRRSRREGKVEHLRDEIEHRLESLVAETEMFGWWTGHTLLEELEHVGRGLRKRLGID